MVARVRAGWSYIPHQTAWIPFRVSAKLLDLTTQLEHLHP